jgi:hypothetical protein
VRDVSSRVGDQRIVVHHDGREGLAAAALAGVVAESWADARIVAASSAASPAERVWVRPVRTGSTPAR